MSDVIVFIPITKCNMRCEYCLHHLSDGYPRNPTVKITTDIIDQVMENAKKNMDLIAVQFTGGEPMLAQDILEYFLTNYPNYEVRIFTNGTIMPKESLLKAMKNYPLFEINLSIDSKDTVPKLYQVLIDNNITICSTALIDDKDLDKNFQTFNFLRTLKLIRFNLSPDYLSTYSEELLAFYKELAKNIGEDIVKKYLEDHILLDNYYELIHSYGTLHNYVYGYDSLEQPHKVWRYGPDGKLIPSVVHSMVDPSIENFNNLFPIVLEMSKEFHNALVPFLNRCGKPLEFKEVTSSPSTFYFGHLMKGIIDVLEEKLSKDQILDLFQQNQRYNR